MYATLSSAAKDAVSGAVPVEQAIVGGVVQVLAVTVAFAKLEEEVVWCARAGVGVEIVDVENAVEAGAEIHRVAGVGVEVVTDAVEAVVAVVAGGWLEGAQGEGVADGCRDDAM